MPRRRRVKTLAVCIICKDDPDCLKENIEYHTLIGVEHFFIYDHGSKIPLKKVLKEYDNVTVELVNKPNLRKKDVKCWKENKSKFKWIAFIDTDEFIVMKDGNTDLKEFLKPYEKYGGLVIWWKAFGSSGHKKKQKSVIHAYTYTPPWGGPAYKTILNTQFGHPLGAHLCKYFKGKFGVDENFKKAPAPTSGWRGSTPSDKIQINHYQFQSDEDFERKIKRCKAEEPNRIRPLNRIKNRIESSKSIKDTHILDLINKINKKKGT